MGHAKSKGRRTAQAVPGVLALAFCLTLLFAPSANATYEQAGCFASHFPGFTESCKPLSEAERKAEGFKFGEEVQLGGVGGMAVNYTGAGGVPAGTVYAATKVSPNSARVVMFTPGTPPASELTFSLSWEITNFGGPYDRCGPALGSTCPLQVGAAPGSVDVDIDPTTGNVYVIEGATTQAGKKFISVYTPDGSAEITRFGERIAEGSKTAESPDKIHNFPSSGAIAVNGAGEVYVFDVNNFDGFYHRLMKFVPKVPGKYDAYEYAGAAEDIGAGFGVAGQPAKPVLDAAGNIYVSPLEASIEMYVPTASPGDPPVCRFEFTKGGTTGITVDPEDGTPFFFSYKAPKRLYQLGACNPATGKFEGSGGEAIVGETQVAPQRDDLWGLAFDPVRKLTGRPAGVLYAGAPSPVPNSGVGKGEPGQSSLGYVFAQPVLETNPPQVLSQSASGVTATTAQLHAEGNPGGFETTYRFQYLTEAEYEANPPEERFAGAAEAPAGGAILGTGKEVLAAAAQLNALQPDTAYRYRVLLESECSPAEPGQICAVPGAAEAFRTFPSTVPGLPDDRAYELASPEQKNGGQVLPAEPHISSCGSIECKPGDTYVHYPMPSAPNGDAVAYQGTNFGGEVGAAIENAYVARRTESGWVSVNPTPSLLQKAAPGYLAYDPSLTEAILGQLYLALGSAPSEYTNLYAQPTTSPFAVEPLVAAQPPNRPARGADEFKLSFAGASKDLSRVFFVANDALTEETAFAPAAVDGGATKFNLYEWERASGQLRLVNVAPGNATTEPGFSFGVASANTISADGSRAFFSDATGQVYVREDAEATVAIPGSGAAAKFLSASTDGSRVLLTNGSLYDLESEEATDLTEGQGGFQGIAGQSDDLSSAYFVATAVLTGEEANSEGAKAQAGEPNLYAWEGAGSTRYVATLLAADNSGVGLVPMGSWSPFPFARSAQASPAGRYLAFLSQAPLSGFDNEGPCSVIGETGELVEAPCAEVYLYDSATGELSCPSCNPSGTASLGHSALRRIKGPGAGPDPLPQPRYLLDSGRLYFDSQESLSLADTNEGVEDVYQYEPEGIGSCERQGGCVSLISAGTGTVDSNLLAVDETAKSVFFTTRDQLVIKDKDELIDLYVAREDGGIPAETETLPGECQGEACQPPVSAPNDPTPGSASFQGAGNVVEGTKPRPRCPKGKARRKGRCVAKKHKQQQRKHHKRAKHERGSTR
jgi:hypothetical protein